jgi:hypothetical protein
MSFVSASEQDAAIARAEQLATGLHWEDAISALEDVKSDVIGDPATIKAASLAQKYYASWCDSLKKPDARLALIRALERFKAKQPEAAGAYGVDEKLKKALDEWQAECQKKRNYQALLDISAEAAAALGDTGKAWRADLYKAALGDLSEEKDPTTFLRTLDDFSKMFPHGIDDLPIFIRKKGAAALVASAEKLAATPAGLDEAMSHCKLAREVALPDEIDPKIAQLLDKCGMAVAKYYETMHDTDLAKTWYDFVATKSANKQLITDAEKASDALVAGAKQYAAMTALPKEMTKATTIKALPVPYSIADTTILRSTGTLTIEKGTCIRGGKLLFENSSLAVHGTRDAPVIFEDVEMGTLADKAKMTMNGEYIIFVRSPISHIDRMFYGGQHTLTLKNCIFIGPAEHVFYGSYGYDIQNCTFNRYRLKLDNFVLKPKDFITGPIAINVNRCEVDPRFIFSVDKVNFVGCKLLTDEKYTLKLHKVFTQKTAWFDKDCQLQAWKTYLVTDPTSTGKTELIPAEKNPICGAEWTCLSFQKPE